MDIGEIRSAYQAVRKEFPFSNYMDLLGNGICFIVAEVCKLLPGKGRLLDIGCGALDKTAFFAKMGFTCYGCDDYKDPWHRRNNNLQLIMKFATYFNITVHIQNGNDYSIPFPKGSFDVVTILDVIEHLHESPRGILNIVGEMLKVGGLCVMTLPNSVNLRKRIKVLMGRSNYPDLKGFYQSSGQWRGHVREYTLFEATQIMQWNGFKIVKVQTYHEMLHKRIHSSIGRLFFKLLTVFVPALRDSILVMAIKPEGWAPKMFSEKEFRESIAPFVPEGVR